MFWLKGKHEFDENDAAMQYWTLQDFTTALAINLLYRLTLLHNDYKKSSFFLIFLQL